MQRSENIPSFAARSMTHGWSGLRAVLEDPERGDGARTNVRLEQPQGRGVQRERVTDRRHEREDDEGEPRARRSGGDPGRYVRPDDIEARAQVLARTVEIIRERQAPGVRTEATKDKYRKRDYEEMYRDLGGDARGLDARRESEDDFDRIVRGDSRQVEKRELELREANRAERRARRGIIRRQFTEMRGRRVTAASFARGGSMDLESLVAARAPIGDADLGFLQELGIGQRVALWAGYMLKYGMEGGRAARAAFDDGEKDTLVRALAESDLTSGGVLVPEEVSEDYIELLYAVNVYLQGGPVRMQLENGVLTLPRVASGATVGWIGENQNVSKTQPTFDAPRLVLRYLAALVPWSNRLAFHTPQALAQLILNDLVQQASNVIDLGCIRGTGTSYQPVGIENQAVAGNQANQAGTSVANITADHAKLNRFLEEAKIPTVRPYWIMAPRTRWALMSARDGNNNLIWAAEMAQGRLWGFPFGVTTHVPTNLGGGGNESKLYRVEMSEEIYAEGVGPDGLSIATSSEATYHDGSGLVSAFAQNQSLTRLVQSAERTSRRSGNNIAILNQVTIA